MTTRQYTAGLLFVLAVYLHNTLPALTMMPRVNVDEPWLMERAYQVMQTGVPSQPMLGLHHAYLLQVGYGYLLALWMTLAGVGILQARLLGVLLGLGIISMVASIGRRTIDPVTGLGAALFLALDSNFLGGVRNARTDIPSVFFGTAAFLAYVVGRQRSRSIWFVCAGGCLGLAVLCHGNAFWVGIVLLGWYLLDHRFRVLAWPSSRAVVGPSPRSGAARNAFAFLGGLALTLGPYLAVVLARWRELQRQIGNFAADRVPGWRPSFLLHQMTLELQRYRGWYFGLVTNTVPNPLLWAFQLAALAGTAALAVRVVPARRSSGQARLLMLVVGSVVIFAAFINNKVPVYMPHLLIGFSLAAGFAVSETGTLLAAALARSRGPGNPQSPLQSAIPPSPKASAGHRSASREGGRNPQSAIHLSLFFLLVYALSGVAYYEKWYSTVRKSELVPYEATAATLRTLVPAGPKYLYASPQFWPPYHDEPGTTFFSYAAAWPIASPSATTLAGAGDDRPIFLIVDELQWLPELTGATSSTTEWQRGWIEFIEQRCGLDGVALGTAHGTLALYRCALAGPAPRQTRDAPRIVGGTTEYTIAERVMTQTAADLARWPRYEDPRRTPAAHPEVQETERGLRISGTGWPGIVKMFEATPGERYLVRADTKQTRDGDLLYLGTWRQPQVRSLAGASSAGIPAPLLREEWFPRDRAFVAAMPPVKVAVYSEAPETDFVISSLEISRLQPVSDADARR